MKENNKDYKTIGEVAKILNLFDKKTGKLATHTLRFWEKEFKQIRPHIFSGKRRYYDYKAIRVIKRIQHLLKNEGMTIKGVKKLLNNKISELDEVKNRTIKSNLVKAKLYKISNIIKKIKNNG